MNHGIPKSGLDTTESPQQAVTIVHPFTSLAMLTMFIQELDQLTLHMFHVVLCVFYV